MGLLYRWYPETETECIEFPKLMWRPAQPSIRTLGLEGVAALLTQRVRERSRMCGLLRGNCVAPGYDFDYLMDWVQ